MFAFSKGAELVSTRRLTVLSLSLQLEFPALKRTLNGARIPSELFVMESCQDVRMIELIPGPTIKQKINIDCAHITRGPYYENVRIRECFSI
jgi:hypothetical protein